VHKKHARRRLAVLGLGMLAVVVSAAVAENIDPGDDDSQYAWGENVGWLNAQPSGAGGPGMQVDDFELSGWLWGENIGWVSLSCKNTSSCDTTDYGVRNNGIGTLSGSAWTENVGWIQFAPMTGGGVFVDVTSGEFSGSAWGENIGWISFHSTGANPFKLLTAWTCDPAPAPPATPPELALARSGNDVDLAWTAISGATGQDIVYGSLTDLRIAGGDFSSATQGCLAEKNTSTSFVVEGAVSDQQDSWYLVRPANCGGNGSYDSDGLSQVGSRDPGIDASGAACP